jgi:CheY-like chemotaxis protein
MPLASSVPVLVVDDSKIIIAVIDKLLRQIGFTEVDDAADGLMALAKMRAKTLRLGNFGLEYAIDDRPGTASAGQKRSGP